MPVEGMSMWTEWLCFLICPSSHWKLQWGQVATPPKVRQTEQPSSPAAPPPDRQPSTSVIDPHHRNGAGGHALRPRGKGTEIAQGKGPNHAGTCPSPQVSQAQTIRDVHRRSDERHATAGHRARVPCPTSWPSPTTKQPPPPGRLTTPPQPCIAHRRRLGRGWSTQGCFQVMGWGLPPSSHLIVKSGFHRNNEWPITAYWHCLQHGDILILKTWRLTWFHLVGTRSKWFSMGDVSLIP